MNNVSFGQFYPANSPIHRLDPRAKIVGAIAYIVAAFLCKNMLAFALLLASAFVLIMIARIPVRIVMKSIRALFLILAFTAILNIFWVVDTSEGAKPLFEWHFIRVYAKGFYHAAYIVVRILCMVIGTSIFLTYTTSPIALTDAIESLLYPLTLLKINVHTFAMMMTIALRFIPTLSEETGKIMNAQKARGVDFSEGGLIRRARALVPILIPLFVSSFRRADELAMAMECRCYRGGKGRTRMTVPHLHVRDFVAVALMVAFGAGILYLNRLGIGYSML